MNEENRTEIQSRFERQMIQCDSSSVTKLVEMAGTVEFALALKLPTCSEQILSLLPDKTAAEIRKISKYFGPIRVVDALDAMESIMLAARILDNLKGQTSITTVVHAERPIKKE